MWRDLHRTTFITLGFQERKIKTMCYFYNLVASSCGSGKKLFIKRNYKKKNIKTYLEKKLGKEDKKKVICEKKKCDNENYPYWRKKKQKIRKTSVKKKNFTPYYTKNFKNNSDNLK